MEPAEQGSDTDHLDDVDPSGQSSQLNPLDPLDRLERALSALIEQNDQLRRERDGLRQQVQRSTARVASLEGELLDANQRRSDVAKRIDELIAQIDQLDAQLAAAPALDERAQT